MSFLWYLQVCTHRVHVHHSVVFAGIDCRNRLQESIPASILVRLNPIARPFRIWSAVTCRWCVRWGARREGYKMRCFASAFALAEIAAQHRVVPAGRVHPGLCQNLPPPGTKPPTQSSPYHTARLILTSAPVRCCCSALISVLPYDLRAEPDLREVQGLLLGTLWQGAEPGRKAGLSHTLTPARTHTRPTSPDRSLLAACSRAAC